MIRVYIACLQQTATGADRSAHTRSEYQPRGYDHAFVRATTPVRRFTSEKGPTPIDPSQGRAAPSGPDPGGSASPAAVPAKSPKATTAPQTAPLVRVRPSFPCFATDDSASLAAQFVSHKPLAPEKDARPFNSRPCIAMPPFEDSIRQTWFFSFRRRTHAGCHRRLVRRCDFASTHGSAQSALSPISALGATGGLSAGATSRQPAGPRNPLSHVSAP